MLLALAEVEFDDRYRGDTIFALLGHHESSSATEYMGYHAAVLAAAGHHWIVHIIRRPVYVGNATIRGAG